PWSGAGLNLERWTTMRSFAKWMLVVGLAALMAGPTMAQEQKGRRGGQGKGGGQGQGRGGGFAGFQFLLANTSVQEELKVTGDQKEKLNALAEDYTKDRRELMPAPGGGAGRRGPDPELQQKMAKLNKDFMTKAEKVLTQSQQDEWKELVGKPFEVRMEFGRGRGRGQDKDK